MAQIVVLRKSHFFSIDNDIIDAHGKTIGAIGVGLYAALCRFANRQTGECWPAIGRLASLLDLARSTVKVYLRKLEAAGLIEIRERRDAAGDPTSNLYRLMDPSPAAIDKRLAAKAASTASAPGGGRPPADLPPVACRPTGRPPADPKPDPHPLTKKENHTEGAHAAEETPETQAVNPCPHPLEERSYYGDIEVCQHCWVLFDIQAATTSEGPAAGEEGQAHATCAA